jgi:tetratricopeptide (TPR) repeat protein
MMVTWVRVVVVTVAIWTIAGAPGIVGVAQADPPSSSGTTSAPSKPVDPDYTTAVQAIKASQYKAAIPLLEKVVQRDSSNADAYNWLGYATRKNGDPAASIPIYQKALTIDPKHRGAHEYIGEAYLMLGDLAKAKEHLARLDKLCFFPCEEYRDLKKAVQDYEKKAGEKKVGG